MEIMRSKSTTKMIFDAHQLSWVYHVIYMIKELLWYVSTWVLYSSAELAGRALHNQVMMLFVSLGQLRYFQMENIFFSNF